MRMTSACALATPAAMVPTPASATSLTLMRARGLTFFRSKMSCAEILDRVDVVVRRRRDQRHARRRVAHARDDRVDLVPGQLAALAGLGALGHLDLELVGVDQVLGGHAEARRRHLLDRRAPRVAVARRDGSARGPRRLRRCSTCRRCGSSRSRGSRAPPWRSMPNDIAPVAKRLTIDAAGSTSSSGTSGPMGCRSHIPRSVISRRV